MYIGSRIYVIPNMHIEYLRTVMVITLAYHNVCIIVCRYVAAIIYSVNMSQALYITWLANISGDCVSVR